MSDPFDIMHRMHWRKLLAVAALLIVTMSLAPAAALALVGQDGVSVAPDFDIRTEIGSNNVPVAGSPALSPVQEGLLDAFRSPDHDLVVKWGPLTRSPSRVYSTTGFLTGPNSADPIAIAKGFLSENRAIFNLVEDDLSETRFSRNYATRHNGVRHITVQQQVHSLDVFGGEVSVNVDPQGRVLSVSGQPIPRVKASVNTKAPVVSSDIATAIAVASAGVAGVRSGPPTRLIYFPTAVNTLRLAWEDTIEDKGSPNVYHNVVDAVDGRLLFRRNLTWSASGPVYTFESPDPNNPVGTSTGLVDRGHVQFDGGGYFSPTDPHFDWWAGAARNITSGNNADTVEDHDGDNVGGAHAYATSGEDFTFPIDLAQDPLNNVNPALVNLFYWINRVHDTFYQFGFDEASGNFQNNNFGLGGVGGDAVRAQAQDVSGICNAYFYPSNEGYPPRMELFFCDGINPRRDGALDNSVIIHEYTHGLSTRLVPGGLFFIQGAGMGEGWSDFMALALLAQPTDDLAGGYALGQWLFHNPNGIRRQLYSTNQYIFTRTFANIRDDTRTHAVGEIWCNTLWIARTYMIWKYGFTAGSDKMLKLVIDGMKLSPPYPDFLDCRDAILQADLVNFGGVNQHLLWKAFAQMGMGSLASTTGYSDGTPVQAFDVPTTYAPNIEVSAVTDLGDIAIGDSRSGGISIHNTGTGDLFVTSVSRIAGSTDFTLGPPTAPLIVGAGLHTDIAVTVTPTSPGPGTATVRVVSEDSDQPQIDIVLTWTSPASVLTIKPAAIGSITIDGSPDDWDLSDFTTCARGGQNAAGDFALVGYDDGLIYYAGYRTSYTLPVNAADHTAKVYCRHDPAYLYFLVRCDDDDLRYPSPVSFNFANDGVEFFIDPGLDFGSVPMSNSTSDARLVIDAKNQKNVYDCTSGYATQVLSGVDSAVVIDGTGWWAEVRVAKSALDPDIPASGIFGLDFSFRDNDNNTDVTKTTHYSWSDNVSGTFHPTKVADRWGRADLAILTPAPPVVTDDGDSTGSLSILHCSWAPGGPGTTEYRYCIGTTPGGTDVAGWTTAGAATEVTVSDLALVENSTYYFSVQAGNGYDYWSPSAHSDGISTPAGVSIPAAKGLADNEIRSIRGVVVSGVFDGSFYIQDDANYSGIRAVSTGDAAPGQMVDVSGVLRGAGLERYIDCTGSAITYYSFPGEPTPCVLSNTILGGGALNAFTPGVKNGTGVNNIGLLVRLFGRVVEIEPVTAPVVPTWFTINDGSNVDIKCLVPTGVAIDPNWRYVAVTGVSSCEQVGDDILPLLRVRSQNDIIPLLIDQ